MALRPLAAKDETLLVGQVLALPPQLWFKGNVGVGLADLLLGSPPSGTMLAVAHCFGLDPIQCVWYPAGSLFAHPLEAPPICSTTLSHTLWNSDTKIQ